LGHWEPKQAVQQKHQPLGFGITSSRWSSPEMPDDWCTITIPFPLVAVVTGALPMIWAIAFPWCHRLKHRIGLETQDQAKGRDTARAFPMAAARHDSGADPANATSRETGATVGAHPFSDKLITP